MGTQLLNRIKQAQLKRKEMATKVKEMEDALPVYTVEELRRLKMPYHEAIACELQEKGLPNTLHFIQQLIEFQEMQRRTYGESVGRRPRLMESKLVLDTLVEGLGKAEVAHNNGDFLAECDEFLNLAKKFGFEVENWAWLGEQLILQAEEMSNEFTGKAAEYKAVSEFFHGQFALLNSDSFDIALEYFEKCRETSEGTHFKVNKYFPEYTHILSEEVCVILYNIYYKKSKQILKTTPNTAGLLAAKARKRALQACHMAGVTEAYLLKGITELVANNLSGAIKSMLAAFKVHLSNEGAYDPRLKIAMERLRQGKTILALEILLTLRNSLNIDGLPYFIAQAYRYLGEIKLSEGEAQAATPLLVTALSIFIELQLVREIEQVRTLAAISSGQELMTKYTELIIKTQRKGNEGLDSMMALLRWKDLREPFWNEEEMSIRTGDSKSYEDVSETMSFVMEEVKAVSEDEEEEEEGWGEDYYETFFIPEKSEDVKLESKVSEATDIEAQGEEEEGELPDIEVDNSWLNEDLYFAIYAQEDEVEEEEELVEEQSDSSDSSHVEVVVEEEPKVEIRRVSEDKDRIVEEYVEIQLSQAYMKRKDV